MDIFETIALKVEEFNKKIDVALERVEAFGTTAAQVTEDISLAMEGMTAQAENISLAFEDSPLIESLDTIATALTEIVDIFAALKDTAIETFSQMGASMSEVTEESSLSLQTAFNDILDVMKTLSTIAGFPKTIEGLKALGENITTASKQVLEFTISTLPSLISSLTGSLPTLAAFGAGLKAAFPFLLLGALIATFIGLFAHLWATNEEFRDNIIGAWEKIKEIGENVWSTIADFFTVKIPAAFRATIDFIEEHWQSLLSFLVNPIQGAITLLYELNPQFKEWVDNLIDNIKEKFGEMAQIGRDIVTGLVNGIGEKIEWAKNAVSNFFGGITDKIKGLFGIQSPSKVFAGIGRHLTEGLVVGIEDTTDKAEKAAEDMARKVASAADSAEFEQLSLFGGDDEPEEQLLVVEKTLLEKVKMFDKAYDEIKNIVLSKFTEMGRKADDMLRRIMADMDLLLRTEGFNAGQNFFRALGSGLISVEGQLMAEALRVADAIAEIFAMRQAEANRLESSRRLAVGFSGNMAGFDGEISAAGFGGDNIVNQYFYGVREEQTAFQTYRATQKALAEGVF